MKELKKKQRGEMAAAMNRRPDHPDNGTENLAKLVCFSLYKSLPGSGFQQVSDDDDNDYWAAAADEEEKLIPILLFKEEMKWQFKRPKGPQ